MPSPHPSDSKLDSRVSLSEAQPSWAGVSFVFEDAFWCDWLFREFDGLRVPRLLINRPSRDGLPYPDRLSVSPDPADPVQLENYAETLRTAQHLIVVVSPFSGRSELMQEHMRTFRAAGGDERIVALVVKGEPGSPTADPAASSDRAWMPPWLQWRFSESGFAAAERSEPLVVDARLGMATLPEVRAQLLAAILEVPEEKLSELGVISRLSTRPAVCLPLSASETQPNQQDAFSGEQSGMGWMTGAVMLTACCAIGGLFFLKAQQDRSATPRSSQHTPAGQVTGANDYWKPGDPLITAVPLAGEPRSKNNEPVTGPIVAVSALPNTDTREFKSLVEKRDRLFFLAEARIKGGDADESFDILKQAADIAGLAIRKSDAGAPHLMRAAEIHRRLGQLASQITTVSEGREHFERGRELIQQARAKGPVGEDGAQVLMDIESGLKKLSAQ